MSSYKVTEASVMVDLSGLDKETVYISGPVTSSGWVIHHLRRAIDAADQVAAAGFIPYIPHMAIIWDLVHPEHDYEFWLYTVTLPWVAKCDYLIRLPGESFGAEKEEEVARMLGKKIFYSVGEFLAWKVDNSPRTTHVGGKL